MPTNLTGTQAMVNAAQQNPLAKWMIFPVSPGQPTNEMGDDISWATADVPQGTQRLRSELARLVPNAGDAANPWAHEALMWSDRYDPTLWTMIETEQAAKARHDPRAIDTAGIDLYHQVRTAMMDGGQPGFDKALAHLASISDRHEPAWTSSVREALRYLMVKGRIVEARRLRDGLDLTGLVRADDAPKADDAAYPSYSMRETGMLNVLILLAEDEDHLVPLLSDKTYDQAPLFNRLSIETMEHLAARNDVPGEWRSTFARTAWTRTYALGRVIDPKLDRLMRSLNPDLTDKWLSHAGRPVRPDDRRVLQDILATPALNTLIDEYGRHRKTPGAIAQGVELDKIDHNKNDNDNWWCPWDPKANDLQLDDALAQTLSGLFGDGPYDDPAKPSKWAQERNGLLSAVRANSFLLRAIDTTEITSLTQIRCAPEILTERTIDWVAHPGLLGSRKGQADTLAATIVTTRWGCDWAGAHGVYSRAALDLLHTHFPTTDAAKRTRYWYNCNDACKMDENGHPSSPRLESLPVAPSIPSVPRGAKTLAERLWSGANDRSAHT